MQRGFIAEFTEVTVSGVVSSESTFGVFVQQQSGGPYSGVWVYLGFDWQNSWPSVTEGTRVTVTGTYEEYFGVSQIEVLNSIFGDVSVGSGGVTPGAAPVRTGALSATHAERWEGVHVVVEGVVVQTVDAAFGDFEVADALGGLIEVSDFTHSWSAFPPGVTDALSSVSGPVHYDDGVFQITPRRDADLVP